MRGPDAVEATPSVPPFLLDIGDLDALFAALRAQGYVVVGPTRRDGAIVYEELDSAAELPAGWTDEQQPGSYRLKRRPDEARFGFAVGPHAWKRYLHPPVLRLLAARRSGRGAAFEAEGALAEPPPKYAFIGVRACELAAIARQDQVFLQGPYVDRSYEARRKDLFIVAVQCTSPSGTCFCASMRTGPRVDGGADLVLTEVAGAGRHVLVGRVGSERGAEVLAAVPHQPATADDEREAAVGVEAAAERMGRSLDVDAVREGLLQNPEHARWDHVAARCLTCGSCTMSCPTCFCTTVDDVLSLRADRAERWRKWDSCFTVDFSYIHGGSVRSSPRSRYRQWLTHKLGTWQDQFGVPGCVGCGRCITWCPVGIDITVEAAAIREAGAGVVGSAVRTESSDDHC
jgi:ferredoxin